MKHLTIWQAIQQPGAARESLKSKTKTVWSTEELRAICRSMAWSDLEDSIFGNHSDALTAKKVQTAKDLDAQFLKLNNTYLLLEDSDENKDLFRTIHQILVLHNTFDVTGYCSISLDNLAYKLLFCFGVNQNMDEILKNWDAITEHHHTKEAFFRYALHRPPFNINMHHWRSLIAQSPDPEAMRLLTLSDLLIKADGSAPTRLEEANQLQHDLLAKTEVSKEVIERVYKSILYEEQEQAFVQALSQENLTRWIENEFEFLDVMQALKLSGSQIKVIDSLGQDKILGWYSRSNFPSRFFNAATERDSYIYFMKHIITPAVFLKDQPKALHVDLFMTRYLPKKVNEHVFMTEILQPEDLRVRIGTFHELIGFVAKVSPDQKMSFLLETVGKEKCRAVIGSTSQLRAAMQYIPYQQGYTFLSSVYSEDEIREFAKDHQEFKTIKRHLGAEERVQLNQLLYSEEQLADKAMLKRISATIKQTRFYIGYFETIRTTNFKGCKITAPDPVMDQIAEFWKLSGKEQTHAEALKNIRKIGETAAKPPDTYLNMFKNLVVSKGENEKYYDKFADEESFKKAFGPKS